MSAGRILVELGLDSGAQGSIRIQNIPTPQSRCPLARQLPSHGRTFCHTVAIPAQKIFLLRRLPLTGGFQSHRPNRCPVGMSELDRLIDRAF